MDTNVKKLDPAERKADGIGSQTGFGITERAFCRDSGAGYRR